MPNDAEGEIDNHFIAINQGDQDPLNRGPLAHPDDDEDEDENE